MKRRPFGEWKDRWEVHVGGNISPETVIKSQQALEDNISFGLTDGVSGVIFSPGNFAIFEFNSGHQIKSEDYLQDKEAFTDAIKMYLAFYDRFIPIQGLLSFPQLRLLDK